MNGIPVVEADAREADVAAEPAPGRQIAYIAGRFPAVSETFVYREVLALRARGWRVEAVSLRLGVDGPTHLREGVFIVFNGRVLERVRDVLAEALFHPVRTIFTLLRCAADALVPGEPTSIRDRARGAFQGMLSLALASELRRRDIRHIHCHFAHAPTTYGMYAAMQLGIPFSFTGHANDLFQRRALLARKLRRAAFVSCISRWHQALYQQICPRDPAAYALIRCGVELPAPLEPPAAAALKRPLQVLTVCRLVPKKGVDLLLRALAEFGRRSGQPWRLTIVGDGPERANLQQLARELNCQDAIDWRGVVDNAQVQQLVSTADLFVLACRTDSQGDRDGIPVVLMEAMASGVPVVAGDLPAIRELVEDGRTGLLFPPEDVAALAECICRLSRCPDTRRKLGQAGRQHVAEAFSLDANVARLEQALMNAIASKGNVK